MKDFRSLIIFLCAAVTIPACFSHAPSEVQEVAVPFTANIVAGDLTVRDITAHPEEDQIVFTVRYKTGRQRSLSLFNPPQGDRLNFLDEGGLDKDKDALTFTVPASSFSEISGAAMKLFDPAEPDKDANYLYVEIFEKTIMDSLGIKIGKLPKLSPPAKTPETVAGYQDVRFADLTKLASPLPDSLIPTLTFNLDTNFGDLAEAGRAVLEMGKNPGLGVRALHERGITGRGVSVAIIDQNLCLNHPEFKGKIADYMDTGCRQHPSTGSMHAPAVTSLLVGETVGSAPGARVYFVAAPSWTGDAEYFAKALEWIVETNRGLPEGSKIRAVSVSAAPSGEGSPFAKNNEYWDVAVREAESAGILVLDCTSDRGIIGPCYYALDDPENVSKCRPGFPGRPGSLPRNKEYVLVPNSLRTVAEEYTDGYPAFAYFGRGGLSWAIPYATGVLALGWQVRPEIGPKEMVRLLFETAHETADGFKVIDPPAFIAAVERLGPGMPE